MHHRTQREKSFYSDRSTPPVGSEKIFCIYRLEQGKVTRQLQERAQRVKKRWRIKLHAAEVCPPPPVVSGEPA